MNTFTISGHRLTHTTKEPFLSNAIGAQVKITFPTDWAGKSATVVFLSMYSVSPYQTAADVLITGTITAGDYTVTVPASVLDIPTGKGPQAGSLRIGVYGTEDETATPTLYTDWLPIYQGAEPSGITPPADPTWVQQVTAAASHNPIITDGYWYVWSFSQSAYINTGVKAEGEAGPNEVTENTDTDFEGLVKGSGGKMAQAVADTDYQSPISDLSTIRAGAALGATAVQTEVDPTVPSWAKAATKPTYTAAEVGADPSGSAATVQGNLDTHTTDTTAHTTAAEKTSWNGKLDASQKGVANGVASLGSDGKVPSAQLPTMDGGVFIATYGTTTAAEVAAAITAGKAVFCSYEDDSGMNHQLMLVDDGQSKYVFSEVQMYTDTTGTVSRSSFSGYAAALGKATSNWEDAAASGGIPAFLSDLTEDSTHRTVSDNEKTIWNDKYDKPSGGIPDTDLSSAVNASLDLADTAYQKPASGIPKTDLVASVQASLGLADTAIQPADYDPESKTSSMTQSVGVDSDGKLWTAPGGGGVDFLTVVDGKVCIVYEEASA